MKSRNYLQRSSIVTGLALALALASYAPSAHANVYATNIKINGALKGASPVGQGSGANISYILNDAASLGVFIQIFSGNTAVLNKIINSGPGTTQGLNTVPWDGKDDGGNYLLPGTYTVQITAGSTGYQYWTKFINVSNAKAHWPAGIAVDTRTDSPYYGRVMVANGVATSTAGSPVGIVKFNANGSEADEGQSAFNGGAPFETDGYLGDSVRSVKYGTDDRVYFNDWTGDGKCVAFDMAMSTYQVILDTDALTGGSIGNWGDIDVTDPGTTNALVWFADANYPPAGVYCWPMTNNGVVDPTAAGFNVVAQGPDIPLRSGFGLMIDESGDIFIGEVRANAGDVTPKASCITNVWGASLGYPTNWWNNDNNAGAGYPITSQDDGWAVGQSDDTARDIAALAIDSRTSPKYVSCAFSGASGGCRILNAADGTLVTNLNQSGTAFYIGTGWDNVGNVYLGNAAYTWEVWSPPGANQATTPAVATVQVVVRPHVTSSGVSGPNAILNFTAGATDPSSAFTLLSAGVASGPYLPAAGAVITGSAGSYQATVPMSGGMQFYRLKR